VSFDPPPRLGLHANGSNGADGSSGAFDDAPSDNDGPAAARGGGALEGGRRGAAAGEARAAGGVRARPRCCARAAGRPRRGRPASEQKILRQKILRRKRLPMGTRKGKRRLGWGEGPGAFPGKGRVDLRPKNGEGEDAMSKTVALHITP